MTSSHLVPGRPGRRECDLVPRPLSLDRDEVEHTQPSNPFMTSSRRMGRGRKRAGTKAAPPLEGRQRRGGGDAPNLSLCRARMPRARRRWTLRSALTRTLGGQHPTSNTRRLRITAAEARTPRDETGPRALRDVRCTSNRGRPHHQHRRRRTQHHREHAGPLFRPSSGEDPGRGRTSAKAIGTAAQRTTSRWRLGPRLPSGREPSSDAAVARRGGVQPGHYGREDRVGRGARPTCIAPMRKGGASDGL
jgi:hypothetical protein